MQRVKQPAEPAVECGNSHSAETFQSPEELLHVALDAAEAGIWTWDVATDVVTWDSRSYALYGIDEPITFDKWIGQVHKDDRTRLLNRVAALQKPDAGEWWREEFRILHPLKGERWLAGLGRVYRQPDGRAARFAGINLDITHRKETEAALRESEERLRLATEAAGIGTYLVDYRTGNVWFSPELAAMHGLPRAVHLTIEQAFQTVHPADLPKLRAVNDAALDPSGDGRLGMELRIVRASGEVRWQSFLGQTEFLDTPAGRVPRRQFGACIDITERKRAEQSLQQLNETLEHQVATRTADLREQQERLRAVLNSAFSAIITIDNRGIVQSVNPAAELMFGYTVAEIVGQNVNRLMPSPYRDQHDDYLQRFLSSDPTPVSGASREVTGQRKDGSIFPAELSIGRVAPLELLIGIVNDISRRKELESEVVAIAALERQRIGQQLHDNCGQQLVALGLLTNGLVAMLDDRDANEAGIARRIQAGIKEVLHQVRSLSWGLAPAEITPEGLPEALRELTARLAESSGIACDFEGDANVTVASHLHASHLYHIAQEACTNALKHGQAQKIVVRLSADRGAVVLAIEDDGRGLEPDTRDGLGRRIMRNRASVIGARLTTEPVHPRGTLVCCRLDLR